MTARAILYDAGGHDREVDLHSVDLDALSKEQLLWVDVSGSPPATLPRAMRTATKSCTTVGSIEIAEEFYSFAVPTREQTSLRFAVGKEWLLTISETRPKFFDEFVTADQGETLKGRLTPTALMASLMLRHLDRFREDIAHIDIAIDKLDETVLRSREKRPPLASLATLRRKLGDIRVVLAAQRKIIHGLVAPDFAAHVSQSDREFLAEVNRLFERLEDDIGRARDTVIGSFELYASRVAQDTNQLLKVLTIATVITGVIGAVAGIFGMNFETPIAQSGFPGFLVVTGAMIAVSVAIVGVAIWRRWV